MSDLGKASTEAPSRDRSRTFAAVVVVEVIVIVALWAFSRYFGT
jgi:hypothetical protein